MPVRKTPRVRTPRVEEEEEDVPETRRRKMLRTADVNSVPVLSILFAIFAVVVIYLSGQVIYHLRILLLLGLVGGFIALILNPMVVTLQHWRVKRRGGAVAIVTFAALLIFLGLAVLFGYPLINGITHFAPALPGYVQSSPARARLDRTPLSQVPRRVVGEAQLEPSHVARHGTRQAGARARQGCALGAPLV